jgi:hypothetical protein
LGTYYSSDILELTIHRAVNFFYFGNHLIPKENVNGDMGIRIIASDWTDGIATFYPTPIVNKYIRIWNNLPTNNARTIGNTLHELGHMVQYKRKTEVGWWVLSNMIRESWASYVGWSVGEAYYASIGYVKPANDYSTITGNHQQLWDANDKKDNDTPIFVDLVDNYNQRTQNTSSTSDDALYLPNDILSLPIEQAHPYIMHVADNIAGVDGLKRYFKSSLPYSAGDIAIFLGAYVDLS